MAFGRDLEHTRDRVGVFGVSQGGVAVERVDRCEPLVAGPGAVPALGLEVIEERADQRRVQVGEVELGRLLAGLPVCVAQQQPERVAVGDDRARAGVALRDQPVGEPCLERRRDLGHSGSPNSPSSRFAISVINSGTASAYQYVDCGVACWICG